MQQEEEKNVLQEENIVSQEEKHTETIQTEEDIPAISVSESGNLKIDFRKLKNTPDAIQEQGTDESMLQPEQPEMGLQEVEQRNEELEIIATKNEEQQEKKLESEVSIEPRLDVEEKVLPENLNKLLKFMEETGGDINDFVKLNTDYSKLDEDSLIIEHLQATNPDLSEEDIEFMMEDKFDFDEDEDDTKEIKRKKLAKKAAVKEAKAYLENLKSKYYEEIKSSSRLTKEQQEAVEFFNRYKEQEQSLNSDVERQQKVFKQKTEEVFNENFNGFEFKIGEKAFKLNIKNADQVKATQMDINNFVKKFLAEDNTIKDAASYHKGLFTAMNPDIIAQHFYEQGKADAIKDTMERSKNIDMNPRGVHNDIPNPTGWSFKAINNGSDSKLKIKR
jgi:hypothetical protein